jgi:hypothetical protein
VKRVLVFLACAVSLALAQSYKVLYSDELERVPATIEVVSGFNTLIVAHDYIETGTLGRPDLLTMTRISRNVIQLNTEASTGVFGMTFVVGGRVQQFTVRIGGGLYNRTYVIQAARNAGVVPVMPAPAPAPAPQPAPRSSAPSPAPAAPAKEAAPAAPAKSWLVTRFADPVPAGKGSWSINFALENNSGQRVSADIARLVIRQGGQEKNFTVSRLPQSGLIDPKATQSGSILVEDVAPGVLELEWTLLETGDNPRTLIVRRTLKVEAP